MFELIGNFNVMQSILFVLAATMTVFMVIQLIMMLIGMGMDDGFDVDTDVSSAADIINDDSLMNIGSLKMLSFRGIVAFVCLGSWMTLSMSYLMWWLPALGLGIVVGLAANFAIAVLNKAMSKMQASGNLDLANSVGKSGEVYLTVPANRKGLGKVNVFVQDKYVELEAVTDSAAPLNTGSRIKIVGYINQGTVVVE